MSLRFQLAIEISMKHVSELGRSFYEFHARCPRCGASFGKASFTELVMGLIPLERYSTSMLSTFFKTLKTAGFLRDLR